MEIDGDRWRSMECVLQLSSCRPVEASVELTSPYTGKVVKVHHKAGTSLIDRVRSNGRNNLDQQSKVHPAEKAEIS